MLLSLLPLATWAQTFVNLTPRPKTMTVGTGSLTMPSEFTVSCNSEDEDVINEATQFVVDYKKATGAEVILSFNNAEALVQVNALPASSALKESGYTINVTADKVTVAAKSGLGFYYAFQSLKKMLPANVMAGVKDAKITSYALPIVSITDEPRFDYRGFMLDVSRHFFTVNEVKRMIDVMAYYKLNAFHWHLTDDQGWRVEIKKYPKLTTVGSIAPNSRFTDMYELTQYWINKPYGPYFYTQDEIKDVVAYAKERHIEVIPEVDMPGHFCAAMAAYPEFSCTPNGSHQVWSDGGISNDVLNVANPQAVQFAKDVLAELIDLFPSEYIHIGGDECPTTAWQNNAECQAEYQRLGLTNYRQLQSHFIKQMDEFVKSKGRKLAVWNESITAEGADLDILKATDATVYCWMPADASVTKATQLGMQSIYTPWGPYYINRRQGNSENDPAGAGDGSDNVQKTYNQAIPSGTSRGVQGTFWCEHVSDADYMEWLALPRLIAVAERGWTPESGKDFADFQKRMSADTVLLNYGNYKYCKYYMLDNGSGESTMTLPHANTADKKYYYRIISGGTDNDRVGRCIELLAETSDLITTYSSKGAAAGRLWTNAQAAEGADNYDYQWWSIEEDPNNPGKFALVCKAQPDGSVNATPTATSTAGRWTYDNSAKHYNFVLGTGAYGKKGDNYYYTLASDQVSGQYMNSSMPGQGLAVNVYNQPTSGAGGQWEFSPLENYDGGNTPVVRFDYLEEGKTYMFSNAVAGFENVTISDDNQGTNLKGNNDAFANNAWTVEAATVNADGSQTLKLKNAATGRYITTVGSYEKPQGFPVSVGDAQADANVTLSYVSKYDDLRIKVGEKSLFPLPAGKVYAGSTIENASYDAARNQGSEWTATEVKVVTLQCVDDKGADLGTVKRSVPASVSEITADLCPVFKNNAVETIESTGENAYKVTYKRSAYAVTYCGKLANGVLVDKQEVDVPVGESYTVANPEYKYFTLQSSDVADGTSLTLDADRTINAVYTTDAIIGVKKEGDVVTSLEAGKDYLFYDATTAAGRAGYRAITEGTSVNRYTAAEGMKPNAIWTLQGSGNVFKVYNAYTKLYIPQLKQSQPTNAAATGENFTFTLNADGVTWNIKGTNGQYWDGLESGALVGWNGGTGHPIRISTFFALPMFTASVVCKDADGNVLSQSEELLEAGSTYTLVVPTIEGYTMSKVEGDEDFTGTLDKKLTVVVTYTKNVADGIGEITTHTSAKQQGIYDLQGRRLQRVQQQGIYIINGKKVLVK